MGLFQVFFYLILWILYSLNLSCLFLFPFHSHSLSFSLFVHLLKVWLIEFRSYLVRGYPQREIFSPDYFWTIRPSIDQFFLFNKTTFWHPTISSILSLKCTSWEGKDTVGVTSYVIITLLPQCQGSWVLLNAGNINLHTDTLLTSSVTGYQLRDCNSLPI